jgi:hypothetical protein
MNPYDQDPSTSSAPVNRMPYILAAIGSGIASLYWFGLTALIILGATLGSISPFQIILPVVLIGLYAWRAIQIFKGDPTAAQKVLWLHGFGGVTAIIQLASGGPLVFVLQGIKLAIHIFGGVTAYLASRAPRLTEAPPW